MKDNDRRLTFTVSLTVPAITTIYQARDYITTAIESWGGGYKKHDPLFSGRIKKVSVKREGKERSRIPMEAEAINLTALIARLQVVECQIRHAGSIPKDKAITVPVKVSEGFGQCRYDIAHITAKPGNAVLLHFDRED